MNKERSFTVNAPIEKVWTVLGDEFDDIGAWSSSVPSSTGSTAPIEIEGAPSAGRTCAVAVPGFDSISERLIHFDRSTHTLAYAVTDGMPGFVKSAVNNWKLEPISPDKTRVTTRIEMTTSGLLGKLAGVPMAINLGRTQQALARDLAVYVETGRPSPAKQKQLARVEQ